MSVDERKTLHNRRLQILHGQRGTDGSLHHADWVQYCVLNRMVSGKGFIRSDTAAGVGEREVKA